MATSLRTAKIDEHSNTVVRPGSFNGLKNAGRVGTKTTFRIASAP
jgi:hypothetical protein